MLRETRKLRIGLVCEGNAATSERAFSGTAKRIYESLLAQGHVVVAVDSSLRSWARNFVLITSFSPDRQRWRAKFRYGIRAGRHRTKAAERSLGAQRVDVILQIGATYDAPHCRSVPFAIYADWNMALSELEAVPGKGDLPSATLKEINHEHALRYRSAGAIFTISERLRESFIDLYGVATTRVHTAYAGPNFDTHLIEAELEKPKRSAPPTILFIAKEFHRKGGDTVAEAFRRVLQAIPQAQLIFAGSKLLPRDFDDIPSIQHLGLLDKEDPVQLGRLLAAYRRADVLVLPSRRDPFPTVIREAMFFGLPCVASNIWAMPEMIEDGTTGFLVEPGDVKALAERLITLLSDPRLRSKMGAAARLRADRMFSWSSIGEVLSDGLVTMLAPDLG